MYTYKFAFFAYLEYTWVYFIFVKSPSGDMQHHVVKISCSIMFFCFALLGWNILASNEETPVMLWINAVAQLVYQPAPSPGFFTSGTVLATITWSANITGTLSYTINQNGTYTFSYLWWTGPYISGMNYSPTHLRNTLSITDTIDRIDHQLPVFTIVFDQSGYAALYFSDNNPGVTATLNGNSYVNGTAITTTWNYLFRVVDVAGNAVTFTFSLFQAPTPPSQGGGWWGLLYRDVCPDGDFSPSYYDSSCEALSTTGHTSPGDDLLGLWLSQELINAYLWAHAYGITTMPTIQQANMTWYILRKHLAKMISVFALQLTDLQPDTNKHCIFTDVKNENAEMQYYAQLACQLGLMGLEENWTTPKSTFDPNEYVTRAQFGTVFSRTLFGNTYNVQSEERTLFTSIKNTIYQIFSSLSAWVGSSATFPQLTRYSKHLQALKDHDIMKKIDTPMILELRGYVLLMMMRAKQSYKFAK